MTTTAPRTSGSPARGPAPDGRPPGGPPAGPARPSRPATRPSRRDPGSTGSWFVSISLVLVVAAASLLVRPMFTTSQWTSDGIVMVAAVIGAAALVRTFTGGVLWPTLASVVAFVVVISLRLQPDSIAGFFEAWGDEVTALVQQFMSDAPPFRETPEAVTGVVAVIGIIAIICDLFVFGLRGRVSAVLPVLVFPILPVATGIADVDLWPTLWLAAAFALYLFATGWWHQRVADDRLADAGYLVDDRGMSGWLGALVAAAAGLVIAIVASIVVPTPAGVPWLMPNPGASLSTNRANPMLDLGDDLRRGEPVPVLEYATSIAQGPLPYLSLVTLTDLDGGQEWAPGAFSADTTTEGGAPLPAAVGVGADAPATVFGANVILEPGVSAFLPHPAHPQRVENLTTTYGFQASTGDIREQDNEALAQHYEYSGVRVDVSPERIAAAQLTVPAEFDDLTSVPSGDAADRIRTVLDDIVDASDPVYEQAQQVQAYLTSDAFTYSEVAPVNAGYDGSNLDVTAEFLDARSGYCVHFSSAMAVMARMLGIPARIQVGFTPGTPTSVNAQGQVVYQVTSNDLHSWAELWIDGYGWVPFEATPAGGLGNTVVPDLNAADTAIEQPAPPTQAPAEPTDQPDAGAQPPASTPPAEAGQDQQNQAGEPGALPAWINPVTFLIAGIALVVLFVLALPMLIRLLQRRRRRGVVQAAARGGAGGGDAMSADPADPHGAARTPAGVAWRELLDEAIDHRAAVPPRAELRRQEARLVEVASQPVRSPVAGDAAAHDTAPGGGPGATASLAPATADVQAAVERLRVALERTAFDRPDAPRAEVDWADVELVERGIRAAATAGGRARAVLLPGSLPGLRVLARQAANRATTRVREAAGRPGGDA